MKPNIRGLIILLCFSCAAHALAFYNPSTGRWLSRDPIEEQGGLSQYGFIQNWGCNGFDLLGLDPVFSSYPYPYPTSPLPPKPPPPPSPLPTDALGFEMCRRDALGTGCQVRLANAFCGGAHSFLRRKYVNEKGEVDYSGWGWNGDNPPTEEGSTTTKPKYPWMVSCAACTRTGKKLEKGDSGKTGLDASDGEIWDCIQKIPARKPYSELGYNCWEWAKEAAEKCGLSCPVPTSLPKPPGY